MSSVAIVGMGCRFAGAPDLQGYWDLLRAGRNAFSAVPADRWPEAAFYDTNRRATDKTSAPRGGFIDDVRSFPALHFGIPPRRVEVMDPQQRLSIEVALQAIWDAGYRPEQMPRRTGVFVGVTASEFRQLLGSRITATLMAAGVFGKPPEDLDALAQAVANVVPSRPFSAPGVLANMIAAAVAQELDLHGPAYTVDAACASAMVAVENAVSQLRTGQIDAAVAGGVYLQLTPEHYVAFSRIGAISPSGECLPFDARADGFVQGDGCGALLLKRLEDAERDGDRIYAVIQGIATNNDGRGDGPMAPVLAGQVEVIRTAWEQAGADPASLGYVEAHGTGTDVGDETELQGLREALGDRATTVRLGSSKANVGHTMSAAGVAGLIRAALAIHHRTVPPMAGFAASKPDIVLDGAPFSVPTAPVAWDAPDRLAGVSSFGFGGTNGHAVLGAPPVRAAAAAERAELVRLSAPDAAALRRTAARVAEAVRRDERTTPTSVARALGVRPGLTHRAAFVAADREQLLAALDELAAGRVPAGGVRAEHSGPAPKVALLFPGQGAQRVGMLASVRDRFPEVAEALVQAEADLQDLLPRPLGELLYPERRAEPVPAEQAEAELTDTAACQPALVAAGIAQWRLLERVGVEPVVAGGHSLGEFVAAVVGGVLSPRDAVRFAALRGRAMAAVDGDAGAMAAVAAAPDEVRALLERVGDRGVVVANENHARQTVISGPTAGVAAVAEAAAAQGLDVKPLKVSHAFHSPLFAGLDAGPWLEAIEVREPGAVTVASCIADAPYRSRADALDVFRRHASSPVRFGALLEQAAETGAQVWIQVGAGPLGSFARKGAARDARAVVTLGSVDDADGGRATLEALGALWAHGVAIDADAFTGEAPVASLPPIELPREPYWPIKDGNQLALKLTAVAPRAVAAAAEPEPEPEAEAGDDVFDKVAGVVARVSSYPRTSVRPEQSLVDDLGFDSLMVGDLATGLAEAFPGLGGLPRELLVNRPTVQAIVDHVRTGGEGGATDADDDAPLLAWRPVWRPCALPEAHVAPGALQGKTVLLVGERDAEIDAALKHAGAALTRRGRAPVDAIVAVAPFEEASRPPSRRWWPAPRCPTARASCCRSSPTRCGCAAPVGAARAARVGPVDGRRGRRGARRGPGGPTAWPRS
ncbi:MAG: beta-ketoacyl synthase N-terminal-like domain-containing protein [Myxococcota bacterium]